MSRSILNRQLLSLLPGVEDIGANVDMFCDHPQEQRPALIRDLVTKLNVAVTRLTRLEVPVLGVGHGTVVGGGLALLAACDVSGPSANAVR